MRPHPRIRKTIKWGGAAVTVLLVVVWVGSGWIAIQWTSATGDRLRLAGGRFEARWLSWRFQEPDRTRFRSLRDRLRPYDPESQGWNSERADGHLDWAFHWTREVIEDRVSVPLWIPASSLIAVTYCAWRLDTLARRRARLNLCPKCNYDRAGIAKGAVCPECGAAAPVGV